MFTIPPHGKRASQNDIFVLARTQDKLITIMVEGKASEPFGPLISERKEEMSDGKKERLEYLCDLLKLDSSEIGNIRYQLLHRSASALITAKRFHSDMGLVLVHSFSDSNASFVDYKAFLNMYGLNANIDQVIGPVFCNRKV